MALVVDKQILHKPKQKHWLSYIQQRIVRNKNFLGFVSGQTGSGKSWASISIAEDLDPEFNIDRVVFSARELMQLINSDTLKRGSVIVFEEMGVAMNSRNWQSIANKMINYLLQTFRHRGFILIMNSPYMDFVDSSMKKLFHAELQTMSIDFKNKTCKLKPQLIQYNSRKQKFYYKFLRVVTGDGAIPVSAWSVAKPSDALIKAYEKKKGAYTDALNKKIYEEIEAAEEKKEKKNRLTPIQQEVVDMVKEGMTLYQIAKVRGVHDQVIRKCFNSIKKKGYEIVPIKEGGNIVKKYRVIEPNTNPSYRTEKRGESKLTYEDSKTPRGDENNGIKAK